MPDQPIPIVWSLHSLFGSEIDAGTVTARVYLAEFNAMLFESQPTPLVATLVGIGTMDQPGLIAPPPNGGVANELYRIGIKKLRLDVLFNNTGAIVSTTAVLQVIRKSTEGWVWLEAMGTPDLSAPTLPAQPFFPSFHFLINHSYRLSGRLENPVANRNGPTIGTLTVFETTFGTSDTHAVETSSFTIGPGGHADFLFAPITKNWSWLISGIWVRNFSEPLSKTFEYSVRYSFSDSYGNFYSDIFSPLTITIHVSVSDEKRAYADGALATLAVGLICAIFTFGAGLTAAQAIAGGLGNRALDPPTPDSRYRERILTSKLRVHPIKGEKRFGELAALLVAVERTVLLTEALSDIHNRLLGARLCKDLNAIQLQSQSYREGEAVLRAATEAVVRLGREAVKAVQDKPEFSRDSIEATLRLWERGGVPKEVQHRLGLGNCCDEVLALVARALKEPAIIGLAQDLPQTLSLLTYSVALGAQELFKRSDRILADA